MLMCVGSAQYCVARCLCVCVLCSECTIVHSTFNQGGGGEGEGKRCVGCEWTCLNLCQLGEAHLCLCLCELQCNWE